MIRAILLLPVLTLGLYGLGEWLRERMLDPEPLSAGRIGRAFGFGLLAHALVMTALGFLWLLRPAIAGTLTALPALVFYRLWWRDLVSVSRQLRTRTLPPLNGVEIVFLALTFGLTLLRGFNALAPNISWDATSHHYLVPSVWLHNGRLSDLPSVIFSYYPSLIEMGIAGTMALGTDFLSNLYGWLYGVVPILVLIGIGTRHFNGRTIDLPLAGTVTVRIQPGRLAGIAAAFLFTTLPGIGVQTSGGYVDLPLACWTLLAIDLLLELGRRANSRLILSAALFAGAGVATKHLGILLFAGLIVLLLWMLYGETEAKETGGGARIRFVATFIAVALLVPLAWYIRSLWLTGNPVFPFGFLGLPTPPHPPFTPASWIRPDFERSLASLATYWLHLTFAPAIGQALGRNYSLAWPLLLPLAFLVLRLKPVGRILAALSGLSVLVVYALFPVETRYQLAFLAPVALVMGLLIGRLVSTPTPWWLPVLLLVAEAAAVWYLTAVGIETSIFAIAVIALVAVGTFLLFSAGTRRRSAVPAFAFLLILGVGTFVYDAREDAHQFSRRWRVVLNVEPEDKYMLSESPFNYGTIHHINHKMDWRNMRVLCLEPRVYRLKADWVTWFGLKEAIVPTTPEENVAIWYRGGFTHILLGDDVALKALMYFNIVHHDLWDIPGATPEEMVEYLEEHPEQDTVRFRLEDLWTNFAGRPFTERSRHFTHFWLPREIEKEMYPVEVIGGEKWFTASRVGILTDQERLNQYAFVRDFREMVETGGIKVVYTDELTFLFECDYPAYLESHPGVDLETLGLARNDR